MYARRFAAVAAMALTGFTINAAMDVADARVRSGRAAIHTQRGDATATSRVEHHRGSRVRDANVTGENGRTRSVHDERTWDRQDGAYQRDHTTTFNDGSTRNVSVDAERTGQGQYSATRDVIGRNGETRTQTGQFETQRTGDGRTTTGEIQTQNHGEVEVSRNVSHQDGVRTTSTAATLEDGRTITSDSTRVRDGADVSYQRDTTFADGSTRSIDRERDGNGDGTGTVTRTVTGRNGQTHTQSGEYEVTRTP